MPVSLRACALALAAAALAACGSGPRPTTVPTPEAGPTASDSPVERRAARASADATAAAIAAMPHTHTLGVEWDLAVHPYERHERVQHYVGVFTGRARGRFVEWMQRGTRYRPMITARLRAAGLPEDLYYLALVESGYEPHAVSHAGAVGMWQFMAPTARDLGLRVDWWVDERRDPVRSTDAAARMLKWMQRQFGSTLVAAAAYNGGPGRVSRGLTQLALASDSSTGDDKFFALAENALVRAETQNYVPQLIAASLVAKDTAVYRLTVKDLAPYAYDSVRVPALVPLAAVARAARASKDELLDLNPQLLRGMTPPGAPTPMRLPVGAAEGFAARLAALDEDDRTAFRIGVTRKRETRAALADRLGTSEAVLAAFNPPLETVRKGKWKGRLVAGQSVRVPTAAVRAYARALTAGEAPGLPALPPAEKAPEPREERPTRVAAAKGKGAAEKRSEAHDAERRSGREADATRGKTSSAERAVASREADSRDAAAAPAARGEESSTKARKSAIVAGVALATVAPARSKAADADGERPTKGSSRAAAKTPEAEAVAAKSSKAATAAPRDSADAKARAKSGATSAEKSGGKPAGKDGAKAAAKDEARPDSKAAAKAAAKPTADAKAATAKDTKVSESKAPAAKRDRAESSKPEAERRDGNASAKEKGDAAKSDDAPKAAAKAGASSAKKPATTPAKTKRADG